MVIERYPKIETQTGVKKQHQDNEQARGDDRKATEARDLKTVLNDAFKKAVEPKRAEFNNQGEVQRVQKENPATRAAALVPDALKTSAKDPSTAGKIFGGEPVVKGGEAKPQPRSIPTVPANVSPTNQAARATSAFVEGVQRGALLNQVLKANTPPTPPTKENKINANTNDLSPNPDQVSQTLEAKVVVVPAQAGEGSKAADTARNRDRFAVKQKGDGKKGEAGKTSGSKGAQASHALDSEGEQKLEAASSGVTSDGQEPIWLADSESGVYVVNPQTPMDNHIHDVLQRHRWYVDGILKSIPDKNPKAVAVVERAVQIDQDPELNQILALGLAARKGPYGGMSA